MRSNSISVVCPTFNSAAFLTQTLSSVFNQSKLPDEIIIVDDGSSDDTISVIESFKDQYTQIPINVYKQSHQGPGKARNLGISKATSEWISFLDSDDIWFQNKFERVFEEMKKHPRANFFSHNEIMINLDGSEHEVNYIKHLDLKQPLPKQLYLQNFFSTSTIVCKKDLLLKWEGFNTTLSSAQDYELWLRISGDLQPVYISDYLGKYVMRQGNISTSKFSKRLINILKVKIIHWRKVSFILALYSIGLTIAYHCLSPLIIKIKASFK
jgi:glycosyltransferase involved in cell wall biosynthesis